MRAVLLGIVTSFAAVACLPQVGPWVLDGGMNEGGGSGGSGGAGGGAGAAGGSGGAAGGTAGCPGFAGCSTFTPGTTIDFGSAGFSYSPKCLRLSAGQTLTFNGSFSNHPLHQACGPVAQRLEHTSGGSSAQFTLTVPGVYGYYCGDHGDSTGANMAGAIEVVP